MSKRAEENFVLNWLGSNFNESKLDTLIDFTIAMIEGDSELGGDEALFHAHTLGFQLGFNKDQTQQIITTVLENFSQALSIPELKFSRFTTHA